MPCDGTETELRQSQRFKRLSAAVQLSVHDIVSNTSQSYNQQHLPKFEKETTALVAELVIYKLERTAHDLEAFAGHAKRSTINTDDVKLMARNNPKLKERLMNLIPEKSNVIRGGKSKGKGAASGTSA